MTRFSTTEEFIEKSRKVHGNKYDYSSVNYIGCRDLIKIICPIHGIFLQKPFCHLNGRGCNICSNNKRSSKEEFAEKGNKIYDNKYDYSLVNYINNKTHVEIICPIHGIFRQRPDNHLHYGCLKCSPDIMSEKMKKIMREKFSYKKDEFIQNSQRIHNNKYNYSKVDYKANYKKVSILCPIHGEFFQAPHNHLYGQGCPKCVLGVSNVSQRWFAYLNNKNIITEYCIKIKNKRFVFDGYDSTTNTIYEFNGDFWHGNPKLYKSSDMNRVVKKTFGQLYKKTVKREKFLKKHGYNVVSIWESDWNALSASLQSSPLSTTPTFTPNFCSNYDFPLRII